MNRVTQLFIAGALIAALAPAVSAAKKATYLQAERAGWMLGMYVGEKKEAPHPFVVQVDKASDAYIKGIREGDELIRVNGEETSPLWRVFDVVNRSRAGRELTIWVRRGAETRRFFVRVPKDPGAPPAEKVAEKDEKKPEEGAEGEEGKDKKKKKKKGPVVVKPIPADGE